MHKFFFTTLIAASLLAAPRVRAQADKPSAEKPAATAAEDPGDAAWETLQKALQGPEEWRTKRPGEDEIGKYAEGLADKVRDFYTKFPKHDHAADARNIERQVLTAALRHGRTKAGERLKEVEDARLKAADVTEEERFQIRKGQVERRAMEKMQGDNQTPGFEELEKGARELLKEFPKRDDPWEMLLMIANMSESDKARQITKEIAQSKASDEVKEQAADLQKKLDRVGQKLALKFTAVDGREVDMAKLEGKVVLVDFWATWCGPCVQELPNVKAAYDKLHAKGFEILGISFDKEKSQLETFVKAKSMAWPQYFDGKGWQNKFGQQFGINSIPAMWLVDKKGVVRDLNARENLAGKVEKLLAEKE